MRIALGLIAATLATPMAIAAIFGALYLFQLGWFQDKTWDMVIANITLYAAFSAPIALFVTMAAGGPMAHRLKELGHVSLSHHAMVGLILGAAPFALFDGYIIGTKLLLDVRPTPDLKELLTAARWAGLGSCCGVWSACAYWLVAIRPGASGASGDDQTRSEWPPSPAQ